MNIRKYDLDWIRVGATLFVFLYHCSMFFNPFPWHVKNNIQDTTYILIFTLLVGSWIMPIFFAISGISTFYALQKRTGKIYIHERLMRLGIPLLFGVFLLSPPQVYMERVSHHQFSGTFFDFFPHYFNGFYLEIGGTNNFAFMGLHLWYLLALLLFSFLTLPFFLRKSKKEVTFTYRHFSLLFLPLLLVTIAIHTVNLGGWDLIFYLVLYIYGFFYLSLASFRSFIEKNGKGTGLVAILTSIVFVYWYLAKGAPESGTTASLIFTCVRVLSSWCSLLFIFYLGNKYLSKRNKILAYTSEASMPFYVIHQPIIVTTGFFIRNLNWAIPVKLVFLISCSFFIIMLIYHFIIKRIPFLRVLCGAR